MYKVHRKKQLKKSAPLEGLLQRPRIKPCTLAWGWTSVTGGHYGPPSADLNLQ